MNESPKGPRWGAGTWVLIVIAVGLAVGSAFAFLFPLPAGPSPSGMPPPPVWQGQLALLGSILSMALLLALLVVYLRSYSHTRAPYVLGLVVFLLVLLFETAASSPLVLTAFGTGPGSLGRFLAVGGFLMSAALAIFLYLSLQ